MQVGLVWLVPSGSSTMTAQLRHCAGPAAELGAGETERLAQEVVHRHLVADLDRTVGGAVDCDGQAGHASAPLIMAAVTGSDRKRWPMAS